MRNCTCYPEFNSHGEHYNDFIAKVFSECLYSRREIASFIVGMSSLAFWIACQIPQFKKNYEKKSASALSKWFLLEWFLGDALNLVGAFMTHQLTTQLATAILFILNDSLMIMQMTYYTYYGAKKPRGDSVVPDMYTPLVEEEEEELSSDEDEDQIGQRRDFSRIAMAAVIIPVYAFAVSNNNKVGNIPEVMVSLGEILGGSGASQIPNCEAQTDVDDVTKHIGTAIGWISAVVYLNSRIPQIIKNQKRGSVEGLSFLMFFCAVMGNTTYGLGVLLKDSSWTAIKKALPWLVGSLGTLVLDFTILLQFWCYDEESTPDRPTRISIDSITSEDGEEDEIVRAMRTSPARGIFGIRAWNTSPFFKPQLHNPQPPPLNLRDTTSLGVLPSEASGLHGNIPRRDVSRSDFDLRERSGSH